MCGWVTGVLQVRAKDALVLIWECGMSLAEMARQLGVGTSGIEFARTNGMSKKCKFSRIKIGPPFDN